MMALAGATWNATVTSAAAGSLDFLGRFSYRPRD